LWQHFNFLSKLKDPGPGKATESESPLGDLEDMHSGAARMPKLELLENDTAGLFMESSSPKFAQK
jgi:hypothetical protein